MSKLSTDMKIELMAEAMQKIVDGCLDLTKAVINLEKRAMKQEERIKELESVAHKQERDPLTTPLC